METNHVIMFRQVGLDYSVQAICSCDWTSDTHAKADEYRAQLQANEHLLRFKGFPIAGPED
jgi:hypothetical protein